MLVEEQILREKFENIKNNKLIIFNDFKDDSIYYIQNYLIEKLNLNNKYEIIKYDNIKDFEKNYNFVVYSNNIFEINKIFFIKGNPSKNLINQIIKDKLEHLFIFFSENFNLENYQENIKKVLVYITYPKFINLEKLISLYLKVNNLNISKDLIEYLSSYFINYTIDLGIILQNIKIYCNENNINNVSKDIIDKYLYLSGEIYSFQLSDFLYKKNKNSFFNLYFHITSTTDGFLKFFYFLLNDVKRLLLIGEIILNQKNSEEFLLNYFNNIGINYNRFRLKYDLEKISNFGINRMIKLLSFLIYISYIIRVYNDDLVKNIFEVYIANLFE